MVRSKPSLGVDFVGLQHHQEKGGLDVYSLGYGEFVAVLIKSVQELSAKVELLEGKVKTLTKED